MTFTHPLALALIAPFMLVLFTSLRGGSYRSLRSILPALLRAFAIISLIVALAQPSVEESAPASGIVALFDASSSMTTAQGEKLLTRAKTIAHDSKSALTVVPFARTAGTPRNESASVPSLIEAASSLDRSATSIETALLAAPSLRSSALLLLSDGYETTGNSLSALSRGTPPIFPLTTEGPVDGEGIEISHLKAPNVAKSKERAEVRLTLSNNTPKASKGSLRVTHGTAEILAKEVTLTAAGESPFVALSDPDVEGIQPIVATYSWRDDRGDHSVSRTTWLSSEKRDKVLLLSGTREDDRFLSRILATHAYQLRAEVLSGSASASIGTPADYRAVILNNVPYDSLPTSFAAAIPAFVREGGGLVTIGGDKSYGLGGYIGSPIEDALPVKLVPPHVEKKRLNVAVQLVIDKSRSMAMEERLEFAKAAANEVVRTLKDDDYIGVIGFDDVPYIPLPITLVAKARSFASEKISRLYPNNKTNLYPSLDEARRGLARVNAGRKHVIVLTDGKLPDAGFYYYDLVHQMRLLGITLSTIMVGTEADDGFLAKLAESGGGSFYQTSDPSNIPRIFLSDVKVASNEKSLKEEPEIGVSRGPDGITSTTITDYPTLRGFVETLARSNAKTELVVSTENNSYPLLASWEYGKGRAISFTSDANGRWSAKWIPWGAINEFWSEVTESAIRSNAGGRAAIDFELRSWSEGGEVIVDLALFESIGASAITATISTPKGSVAATFTPLSQGHYQARIPEAAAGKYVATVTVGKSTLPDVAWEISDESFIERPRRLPNLPLLQQIADRSGGRVNPSTAEVARLLQESSTSRSLAMPLITLALILFLCELLYRALPLLAATVRRGSRAV